MPAIRALRKTLAERPASTGKKKEGGGKDSYARHGGGCRFVKAEKNHVI